MLVKLAFVMEKFKKIFVMIDKDGGGTIFGFYRGGHSCYEGGTQSSWGSPPLGKTLGP